MQATYNVYLKGNILFSLSTIHPSWKKTINDALNAMDQDYLSSIHQDEFLPENSRVFNAFSIPKNKVQYVLFGETPYPRKASANGYAFWDGAVTNIWSETGLSKQVNRATSLRNIMKMLLLSEGLLEKDQLTQPMIAKIDKTKLISSLDELFQNLMGHGFLLLNASLILREKKKNLDAKNWLPFMNKILESLYQENANVELLLFGKIAEKIQALPASKPFKKLVAEHPYNISFITNANILNFFKDIQLLS